MKKFKPTSPSRRNMSTIKYRDFLTATEPHKSLTKGFKRSVGRNNAGRITTRHKGGGHKKLYREIDFVYNKKDIPAKIETVEYDPNRTSFIALACYADGERRYVVVPQSMKPGDSFVVGENVKVSTGNRMPLSNIPVGTFVFNIELQYEGGSKLVRSAGNYAEVVAQDADAKITQIKLPSSEIRKVKSNCWATIGSVSNPENKLRNIGKAGRSRHMGIRPTVRGSAMNPVDHPHGGGEGRQGIGLRRGPKTQQGKLAYGVKTRKAKKYSNKMIVSRRKTKRNK
jgi:large subunit ribosomal protein L2